jgi:hypothetical protein
MIYKPKDLREQVFVIVVGGLLSPFWFVPSLILLVALAILMGFHAIFFGRGRPMTPKAKYFGRLVIGATYSIGAVAFIVWNVLFIARLTGHPISLL